MYAIVLPEDVVVLHGGATLPAGVVLDAMRGVAKRGTEELLLLVRPKAEPSQWQYSYSPTLWLSVSRDYAYKLDLLWSLHSSAVGPLRSKVGRITRVGIVYEIDFTSMLQTSTATGTSRGIRREPASATRPTAPHPDHAATTEPAARRGHYAEHNTIAKLMPRPIVAGSRETTRRLIFPSISTGGFNFDLDRAARIACEEVARFLTKYPASHCPHLELSLVDLSPDQKPTPTIRAFAQAWSDVGVPDARFNFAICDFADPAARGPCFAVVNASNANFTGGPDTTGFNHAVYVAAGTHDLEKTTKAKYGDKGKVGVAYPVDLPSKSPLRVSSGTRLVIHVVGPNMNTAGPFNCLHGDNCLNGDYVKGVVLLRSAYRQSLEVYASALGLHAH
jgi:hypothetical protein